MATFEGKVVQERCPHTISYAKSRTTYEGARRCKVRPRMPRKPPKPPPRLKKQSRRRTVEKDAVKEKKGVNEKTFQLSDTTVVEEAATILPKYTTNFETAKSKSKPAERVAKSKLSWEEHVIGQLSAESADHVIKEVTSSVQAERLRRFLVQCRAAPDTRGGDDGDNDDDVILNDVEVDDVCDESELPTKCGDKPSSSDSLSKYPDKGVTSNQEQDVYPRKPCDWVTTSDNEKELVKRKGNKNILHCPVSKF